MDLRKWPLNVVSCFISATRLTDPPAASFYKGFASTTWQNPFFSPMQDYSKSYRPVLSYAEESFYRLNLNATLIVVPYGPFT